MEILNQTVKDGGFKIECKENGKNSTDEKTVSEQIVPFQQNGALTLKNNGHEYGEL